MTEPHATVTHRHDPVPAHADPLAQAGLCSLCPKLCRPTCPVQHATGRESVAPWRISATVRAARGSGWTAPALHAAASCTGCGACGHACLAGTNLPEESRAARAAAAGAGVPLPAAARLRDRIARTGSPRSGSPGSGSPRRPGDAALDAGSDPTAATALFFGCTVQAHTPAVGVAARRVFAAAGEPVRCAATEPCCGAVALDLGLPEEARALAARAAAALGDARRVVVVSPGCARAMREEWPRLGVAAPPAVTLPEWLAEAVAAGRLRLAPRQTRVAWHDPCTLARGLGVLAAPRAVLAALGADVREPDATGVHTRCSGGGAAYPLVDPAGADKVTAVRRAELAGLGASTVTACPEAMRRLGGRDLVELVADHLAEDI